LLNRNFSLILFLLLPLNSFSILKADIKENIIQNISNVETLSFSFNQISLDKKENGICFLKRPQYLKCEYNDKNQKELIVNRKKLVIYNKRYKKIYSYPLSKSYFNEILDKNKFSKMINGGIVKKEKNNFIVDCYLKEKGNIILYFNVKNYDLMGWDLISLNNSKIQFRMFNNSKNLKIDEKIFDIPKIN
tara:strand:- start:582 stop:1151 length:570 start_codon:yes stop_codon:yes gene_type:complete